MLRWPDKDPNAEKDYSIDWSARMSTGDGVSSALWTSTPSGLTLSDESILANVCTVWLAGGTAGVAYQLTCRITTTNGMIDDQTVTIKIAEQ